MTRLVGILNITPDSFSDGGKFNSEEAALFQAKQMLEQGVDVLDVGAESTRPSAVAISADDEWNRLEKILPKIISAVKDFNQKNQKNIQTSIDSYHFETIVKSYELGVDIINDISGLADERVVSFIAEKNITTVLMHNALIHTNPELLINPHLDLIKEIINWGHKKIIALSKAGVKKSQLIFDPGIGFKKNAAQSIRILKNIDAFRVFGLPLYVGHSKKSFLDSLKIDGDRAGKTLEVSKYLIAKKVEFIRVHDVLSHKIW